MRKYHQTGGRKLCSRYDLHKAIGRNLIGRTVFPWHENENQGYDVFIIIIIAMLYYIVESRT